MTRFTMAAVEDWIRRGRVAQSDVDRIIESQIAGRKRQQAVEDAAIADTRITLITPVDFTVPIELWTENKQRAACSRLQCMAAHLQGQDAGAPGHGDVHQVRAAHGRPRFPCSSVQACYR